MWRFIRRKELGCVKKSPRLTNVARITVCTVKLVKVRKNGQQKTSNLFCNIAAKRVEKRCCAFYHPSSNLLTTWFVARQVLCGWYNVQHRYSTRFAEMLQNKLHVFCCAVFRTLSYARAEPLRERVFHVEEIPYIENKFDVREFKSCTYMANVKNFSK